MQRILLNYFKRQGFLFELYERKKNYEESCAKWQTVENLLVFEDIKESNETVLSFFLHLISWQMKI